MQSTRQKKSLTESSKQAIEEHRAAGWAELDSERLLFASTYISCGYCHHLAAEELGMEKSQARRFLNDPLVRAYLRDYSDNISEISHITVDFLRSKLIDLIPKLEGKEEVDIFIPQMGASVTAKKFHGAELLRALDALGKHIGFNTDLEDDQASAVENLLRKAMQRKRERETLIIENPSESPGTTQRSESYDESSGSN